MALSIIVSLRSYLYINLKGIIFIKVISLTLTIAKPF